jgi:hypothetical protein
MRASFLLIFLMSAAGCDGCNSTHGFGPPGSKDMAYEWGDMGPPMTGQLYITPPTATLQITYGGPAA